MTTGTDHLTSLIGETVYIYRKPHKIQSIHKVLNLDGFVCFNEHDQVVFLTQFQVDKVLKDKVGLAYE